MSRDPKKKYSIVMVNIESKFFVKCPRCGTKKYVDSWCIGIFNCDNCGEKEYQYNSSPNRCESV